LGEDEVAGVLDHTRPRWDGGLSRGRIVPLAVLLSALLVAGAIAAESDPQADSQPPAPKKHDPLAGMDPDGRIPKPPFPDDLPNPERWRYIPEGRLHPGNVLQRLLVTSFPIPTFSFSGDVGAGFGLSIADIDFRGQRRQEFIRAGGSYTTEGQQSYDFSWRRWLHHLELPSGGVIQEERTFVAASAGYKKTLTRHYFGRGRKADTDSSFTDERVSFELRLDHALPEPGGDWVLSGGIRAQFHDLDEGEAENKPDTKDAFTNTFDRDRKTTLGWLQGGIAWDTRDSQANPYGGTQVRLTAGWAAIQQDLGKMGGRFSLRASHVFPVPGLFHSGGDADEENPPTDTIGFSFVNTTSVGDLPFFELPTIGGDSRLRGDINGRWRDTAVWSASAEYRFWWLPRGFKITDSIRVERLGLALFYDIGGLAPDWPGLFISRPIHSFGPSLRISLERGAPFRVDFGWSSENDMNITAKFGLPW